MHGMCNFLDIITLLAVIIVLHITQHISLISSSNDETFPILIDAPIETNRDRNAPLDGDSTTKDEV